MKKSKLFGYVMTGALSLGVIGGAGVQTFAATNNTTAAVEQAVNVKANLDDETKQKVQAIMDELKNQLADLGVELPTKEIKVKHDFLENLDDETKEKAQAIMEKVKDGSITFEEAQTQLTELGVELPDKGIKAVRGNLFENLDDETKEKAQAIIEKVKDGSITSEEAQTQLTELGIELPTKGIRSVRGNLFENLDDETKEKAQAIMEKVKDGSITSEEAKTQLAELGVELPTKGIKVKSDFFENLDDETKEQAQALVEAAQEQLSELGVNHLPFKAFGDF